MILASIVESGNRQLWGWSVYAAGALFYFIFSCVCGTNFFAFTWEYSGVQPLPTIPVGHVDKSQIQGTCPTSIGIATFLDKIFNHMADFETDFGNVNVVLEGRPILELNIQPIIRAAWTMKAFEDNIILHQSLDNPIIISPSSIKAYTLSPWIKTNVCHNSAIDALSCDDKHTEQEDY